MINAEIIADSLAPNGSRCTTFVLTMPRIVLAEFNTHRMLSRNSASSRAVPFDKMVERVENNPFIPIKWMKDHSGMQGDEYWTEEDLVKDNVKEVPEWLSGDVTMPQYLENVWLSERDEAVKHASVLNGDNITKQFCNRLLEPFMWHTVIATGTEWENFFALRAHEAAEIHIQGLAFKMLELYNENTPVSLEAGEWHIPFGDKFDTDRLGMVVAKEGAMAFEGIAADKDLDPLEVPKVKIATARCARVSYINYEGKDDYEADIKLHDRLSSLGHWSPFEHCAKAMNEREYYSHIRDDDFMPSKLPDDDGLAIRGNNVYPKDSKKFGWSGNLKGFIQYRKMFEGENKTDTRVEAKTYGPHES